MQNLEITILSQYATSPSLIAIISAFNANVDPSENINDFLTLLWDLNTAQGFGLDCWGRIVGVSRVYQVANTVFFGFSGPDGGSGDSMNVAPFYNGQQTTQNYALSDDAFRIVILCKATANICDGSILAINGILTYLNSSLAALGLSVPGNCYCTDLGGMAMTYTFKLGLSVLPPVLQSIVSQSGVLPRPAGVAASVVVM